MTMNSRQRRLLRRRSPPRIIPINGGQGISAPNHAVKPIETKPDVEIEESQIPFNPILVGIISTGDGKDIEVHDVEKTTVLEQKGQEEFPRIHVSRLNSSHLTKEEDKLRQEKKQQSQSDSEEEVKVRIPQTGSDFNNRFMRRQRTKDILAKGALLEPGTRQVWKLPESYNPKLIANPPSIRIRGTQGVRVTFHRNAGGIIQAVELPPCSNIANIHLKADHIEEAGNAEILVPRGTRFFTLEGLGGKGKIEIEDDVSSQSILTRYPSGEFSAVGFQRVSTMHQIGYFRYLGQGCFVQAMESSAKGTMQDQTVFSAGEVLSKVDNLRFYSTSKINTFVLILRTMDEKAPFLQIGMEGVSPKGSPHVIKRKDGYAYVWSLIKKEFYYGPAIIDIQTDETTDVNSAFGFAAEAKVVTEKLSEERWTKLVRDGPISYQGHSFSTWEHEQEKVQEKPKPKPPKAEKKPEPEKQIMAEKPRKEVLDKSAQNLPRINLPDATVGEAFKFDLSIFANDDDDDDEIVFKQMSDNEWIEINSSGHLSGTPTSKHVGLNQLIVRILDRGGLSSDAVVCIEVKEKILNRAPYWKPNVQLQTDPKHPIVREETKQVAQKEKMDKEKKNQEILEKESKNESQKSPNKATRTRRRRR